VTKEIVTIYKLWQLYQLVTRRVFWRDNVQIFRHKEDHQGLYNTPWLLTVKNHFYSIDRESKGYHHLEIEKSSQKVYLKKLKSKMKWLSWILPVEPNVIRIPPYSPLPIYCLYSLITKLTRGLRKESCNPGRSSSWRRQNWCWKRREENIKHIN
jgi:hypothetical protein